ncbi:MAG: efflux RND transporter periplasmic adaptor subunit [Planctomycetales bacterium]|nr:efflux RND transporter periplasmic adaptor subunit [Planctomycetales bacterium]
MSKSHEHFACDQSTTSIVFRDELRCTPGDNDRQPHVIIEDPVSGTFYRLGKMEYALASLMTGGRTIAEAFQLLCQRFPEHHLSEEDAGELGRWLIDNELAHTESSLVASRMVDSAKKSDFAKIKQRSNPVMIRIPLVHPDRLVSRLDRWIGWFFGVYATFLGAAILMIAGGMAIQNWSELRKSSEYLFSGSSLIQLAVITVVLKVIHEFAHALTCKRYGGEVREMGVLLILLAPLAYVDVSSVWRFRNRWHRIHVAVAGIYVEMLIASLAMFVWQLTDSAFIRHLCVRTMLTASVASLLFNANPLMKFDGYFVLTDWARCPNLYTDSQKYLVRLSRRLFLGEETREPDWRAGYRIAVACYGWLAFLWRCFVCVGLAIAATKYFHGLGVVLAITAGVCWVGIPTWNALKHVLRSGKTQRRRCLTVSGMVALAVGLTLIFVPWIGTNTVPAVVEFSPHVVVRADVPGFVESIHVLPGDAVAVGQPLLTLRNRDLTLTASNLERKIQQATIRQRQHLLKGQRAAAQAEAAEIESLTKQHDEALRQVDSLTVRAPIAGTVIRRRLDVLGGTYVKLGDEILVLGNETQKELRLLIPHSKYERFRDQIGTSVSYRTGVFSAGEAILANINPRAKTVVEYPALLATNGGPLGVKAVSNHPQESESQLELLVPHFEAVVPLDRSQSMTLHSGQRVLVSITGGNESIGLHWWRFLADLAA